MVHAATYNQWTVTVLAPVPYYPPIPFGWRRQYRAIKKFEVFNGLAVHHPTFFMIPKIGMFLQGLLLFVSMWNFVRQLRDTVGFDCIDVHYAYPEGVAGVLLGLAFGKPVVITVRGSDVNVFQHFPLIRWWLRFALRRAESVIVVSHALQKAVVGLGVTFDRIQVIPNGVDAKKFYPLSQVEARGKLDIPLNKKVLLSVGNLTVNKGMDFLVRAVHEVRKIPGFSDIKLLIVGGGPQEGALKQLIADLSLEDQVSLVGKIDHADLSIWYSAADVSCLMSEREGWPNVILESLACETPVLATRAGGIPEIMQSSELGLLVDRNLEAIIKGMQTVLTTKWDTQVIRRYAESHSWDHVSHELKGVFESIGCRTLNA